MPVLNTADKLFLGTQTVAAAYAGVNNVWSPPVAYGPQERMLAATAPTTNGSGTFTIGTRFTVTAAGRITHIRYWHRTGPTTRTLSIWTNAGAKLASVVDATGAAATGWREIALPTPLNVTAATGYTVSYSTTGPYSFTNSNPVSGAAHLTGPGAYWVSGVDVFPGTSVANTNYHADVVYQPLIPPVVPAWTPNDLPGLVIWLDASQLALADGAYIDTWPSVVGSLVGTNFNAAPYRPVLRANALNGRKVARFTPGGGLRWPDHGIDLNYTVSYVIRIWDRLDVAGRVVSGGYPPANIAAGHHAAYEDRVYVEGWLYPDVSRPQTTNWKLYTVTGDGGPGTAKAWFYSNGVFLTGDHLVSGGWKGTFHLNGYNPTGGEETTYSEIAEVVFYNRKLPDAERLQVEGYLRTKWGL